MKSYLRTLALSAALVSSACLTVTPPGIQFSTRPSGAAVFLNGEDSGFVTPCMIALDDEEDYRVRVELTGYTGREVLLRASERKYDIQWWDGSSAPDGKHFPLFLGAADLFLPLRNDYAHSPKRVFLRLQSESGR